VGWELNGVALTDAQETLLAMAVFCWRTYADRPNRRFIGAPGNEGRNIEPIAFHLLMHPDLPEGNMLYTSGDPALADIDIDAGS
jgi:hypothetical protein